MSSAIPSVRPSSSEVQSPSQYASFIKIKNYETDTKPSGPLKKAIRLILKELEDKESSTVEKRTFKILELGSGGAQGVYQVAKSQLKDKFNVEITSVEKDPLGAEYALKVANKEDIKGKVHIKAVTQDFEEFLAANKEEYDLIIASYSLFYAEHFEETLDKVLLSVKEGGLFCGHFLGDKDDWKKEDIGTKVHFTSKEDVKKTFKEHSFSFVGYKDKGIIPFEIAAQKWIIGNGVEFDVPGSRGTKSNAEGFKDRFKIGRKGKAFKDGEMHSFHVVAKKDSKKLDS